MASVKSFKELRVWQNAMDAAMRVFEISKRFPAEERYSLTDQFRRSSRSVAANISEAWRKRRYPAAFTAKLCECEAEAAEAQTWTELARRCDYISAIEAEDLTRMFDEMLGQLAHMIEHRDDWTSLYKH